LLPSSLERQRRQMTDGTVGPLLVVDRQPVAGCSTLFVERPELMGVEHFESIRTVESLDVRVLRRITGLDEVQWM
jgi:hypothetical protein